MAYRFRGKDRSVELAVRRIAREQVDGAIAAIAAKQPALAVHEVRRCCKKVRALVRLVRPGLECARHENESFRQIAALLSGSRDAKVLLDTFDLLVADAPDELDQGSLETARRHLSDHRDHAASATGADLLDEARVRLGTAVVRIENWAIAGDGKGDGWQALEGGLLRIYRQGREDARGLDASAPAEAWHDLRKQVKYHWYHTRLLQPVWPGPMRQREGQLGRLGEVLGQHHDICVFAAHVGSHPDTVGAAGEALLVLANARRAQIEEEALPQLQRLYAQSPKALGQYWRKLWRIWRG